MKRLLVLTALLAAGAFCHAQYSVEDRINFSPLYYMDASEMFSDGRQYDWIFHVLDGAFIMRGSQDGNTIRYSGDAGDYGFVGHWPIKESGGYRFFDSTGDTKSVYAKRHPYSFLLEGQGILIILPGDPDSIATRTPLTDEQIIEGERFLRRKRDTTWRGWDHGWFRVFAFDDGIKSISASSELVEGGVRYAASNLKDRLYTVYNDEPFFYEFDYVTPPWVEGASGYGIGEYLDVEFKYKSDEMQILNGFVDFRRKYLYKENSRVARISVESQDPYFFIEYTLEDAVKYTLIELPEKTDRVRIRIESVYRGDKYMDTCLSSILVTNPNLPSFEEQRKKVVSMMQASGAWKKFDELRLSVSGK